MSTSGRLTTLAALALTAGLLTAPAHAGTTPTEPAEEQAEMPSHEQWRSDVFAAMDGSHAFLRRRALDPGAAVNLDIDNTALATHYDPGQATPRVLRFARKAHELGIEVVFNTARKAGGGNLRDTSRVLQREGFPVDAICGRLKGMSVVEGKQRCRARFAARGHVLVANVGNRDTDFEGGGYRRAYRLPNYDNRLT